MTADATVPTRRRANRRPARWPHALGAAALLAAWWLTLAPTVLGGPVTYVVIRGDSMLPTFAAGDLVLARVDASYEAGDVVAYRVPDGEIGAQRVVIHRIVERDPAGAYVLLGDHNPAPDPWRPRASDIVGVAWLRLPLFGGLVAALRDPAVVAALAAAIVVWIAIMRWPEAARTRRRAAPEAVARGSGLGGAA